MGGCPRTHQEKGKPTSFSGLWLPSEIAHKPDFFFYSSAGDWLPVFDPHTTTT